MIVLITGVPGSGKTLWTLWTVKARAAKEGRPVYYYGIPDLTLDWHLLDDPRKWGDCPPGSIIVIDEAQKVFPPRPNGSAVPSHVSAFETHRHNGHDVYLITQHPTLLDSHVRKLVGRHHHVVRQFGFNRSKVYERQQCCDQPNNSTLRDAPVSDFPYPKEVFGYYKSAEVHTHKPHVPKKYWLLVILPVVIVGLLWFAYASMTSAVDASATPKSTMPGAQSADQKASSPHPAPLGYLDKRLPRLPDWRHTAPVYDDLTVPDAAPYPLGCFDTGHACRCYSQQGTALLMSPETCRSVLRDGFFRDWGHQKSGESKRPAMAPSAPSMPILEALK